jgi:hypothetical protein
MLALKGFALIDYTWCRYVLEDAPEGEYIYRFVASYLRWVYFRKKTAGSEFNVAPLNRKINALKKRY